MHNLPLHLECKWTQRLNLTDAMAQAQQITIQPPSWPLLIAS